MGYSGACQKLIHEKNLMSKISWHCPFDPYPLLWRREWHRQAGHQINSQLDQPGFHPPQAPENSIRVISNFFENSRRYLRRYLRAPRPPVSTTPAVNIPSGTTGVVETDGKFATDVNDTRLITSGK